MSCSSDDNSLSNNNPPDNSVVYTLPNAIIGTQWFQDKTVYELEDGSEIELQLNECESTSWFEISSSLNTHNNNFMDDGNGNCIEDPDDDAYYMGYLGESRYNVIHLDFTTSNQDERIYEFILENNGINDEPHTNNVMIWIEHDSEELYNGQSLNSKRIYFNRRR